MTISEYALYVQGTYIGIKGESQLKENASQFTTDSYRLLRRYRGTARGTACGTAPADARLGAPCMAQKHAKMVAEPKRQLEELTPPSELFRALGAGPTTARSLRTVETEGWGGVGK